jgi:hypothetical protein
LVPASQWWLPSLLPSLLLPPSLLPSLLPSPQHMNPYPASASAEHIEGYTVAYWLISS